jgi:tetratricopeptide (TPR) repeat protein
MSLLTPFTKKAKLNSTIKQTEQARSSEGNIANQLFKSAYQGYAEVLLDDPLRAQALYHWGFALLHQAKTKTGTDAAKLYQDAIAKFSFCLLINPDYLGAAINGGVAYMDLARLNQVTADDPLYELAKTQFERANAIQKGTASYNLACIYALRGADEACLSALTHSKERGSLPDAHEIVEDPDLDTVKTKDWFIAFVDALTQKTEIVAVVAESAPSEAPVSNDTSADTIISNDAGSDN